MQTVFEMAKEAGYTGTLEELIAMFRGEPGPAGKDGVTPHIGKNGNWWVDSTDLGVPAQGAQGAQGPQGAPGADGKDGVSISNATINDKGELVLTLSNGISLNLGKVVGAKGDNGKDGEEGEDGVGIQNIKIDDNGNLIVILTNGTVMDLGNIKGDKGDQGEQGPEGPQGEKGRGILKVEIIDGYLWITYSDAPNTPVNAGSILYEEPTVEHIFTAWITVKNATCTANGIEQRYCTECGYTESKTINAYGHCVVIDAAIAPTCTETGLTEGKHCSTCGEILVAQEVIPVVHSFENRICTICGALQYSEGLAFVSNGDGTCYVKGIGICTDTYIIIPPQSPDGFAVTAIGSQAFRQNKTITSVVIPDSVIVIGDNSFAGCDYLKSVKIGNGVTTIADSAFDVCWSLTDLTIGNNVTGIGIRAFYECSKLTSVSIPDSVEVIGDRAFAYCKSLKNVTLGEKILTIGSQAFEGCIKLTSVVIPDSTQAIGQGAFGGCGSLRSVTVGANVKSIGGNAFYNCERLAEVVNRSSLYVIKNSTDHGYLAYYAIEVHKTESKILNIDEYVFYHLNGVNYLLGYNGDDSDLVLPTSCNGETYEIYDKAFYNMSNITSLVISGGIVNVGNRAFGKCTNLTSVEILNDVARIGNYMFAECSKLSSVIISGSVTRIGSNAFQYCNSALNIYYTGDKQGWSEISMAYDNTELKQATIHYNYIPE
jgi:hypothetical protein